MAKMTQKEWENLYENFETTWLLAAVDHIDNARGYLGDGENCEPPRFISKKFNVKKLAFRKFLNNYNELG